MERRLQSAEQFSGYSSQLGCGQGSGQPRPLIMPIQLNHCSLTRCKATLLARVEDFPVKKKERKKLGEAGSVSWQFFNFSRNISRIKLRKLIKENHETIISRGKSDFFPFCSSGKLLGSKELFHPSCRSPPSFFLFFLI